MGECRGDVGAEDKTPHARVEWGGDGERVSPSQPTLGDLRASSAPPAGSGQKLGASQSHRTLLVER